MNPFQRVFVRMAKLLLLGNLSVSVFLLVVHNYYLLRGGFGFIRFVFPRFHSKSEFVQFSRTRNQHTFILDPTLRKARFQDPWSAILHRYKVAILFGSSVELSFHSLGLISLATYWTSKVSRVSQSFHFNRIVILIGWITCMVSRHHLGGSKAAQYLSSCKTHTSQFPPHGKIGRQISLLVFNVCQVNRFSTNQKVAPKLSAFLMKQ